MENALIVVVTSVASLLLWEGILKPTWRRLFQTPKLKIGLEVDPDRGDSDRLRLIIVNDSKSPGLHPVIQVGFSPELAVELDTPRQYALHQKGIKREGGADWDLFEAAHIQQVQLLQGGWEAGLFWFPRVSDGFGYCSARLKTSNAGEVAKTFRVRLSSGKPTVSDPGPSAPTV